jgi:hypothetical protein
MNSKSNVGKLFILSVLFLFLSSSVVLAAPPAPFEEKTSYDIYLQSSEEKLNIISDVEIVTFLKIGEELFLVVRSSEFSLNNTDGYVLFKSVQAILPNRKLGMNSSDRLKIK